MGWKCERCLKEFTTHRDYQRHLDRKRPCKVGEFVCNECEGCFTTKRALNLHVKDYCKGRPTILVARDLANENEELRIQLAQQDQLLQMTNHVTAAGASSSHASERPPIQQNVTINVEHLHITANIGEETLGHFTRLSKEESRKLLDLRHNPESMAKWCALVRADDNHPENHNALLMSEDSKHMACNRNGHWALDDRDKVLQELSRADMLRYYNHLGRYENDDEAIAFRNEYLLHGLMSASNAGDCEGMKPLLKAIARPIIELTQKYYVSVDAEQDIQQLSPQLDSMQTEIIQMQQDILKDEEIFQMMQAKRMAALLRMRRTMSELVKQHTD